MLKCSVCGFENKVEDSCAQCGSALQRYVKAIRLGEMDDVAAIKKELDAGNILIVNIVPFLAKECRASRDFSKMVEVTDELLEYALSIGGDAARIGDERLVLAPSSIRIWGSTLRSRVNPDR